MGFFINTRYNLKKIYRFFYDLFPVNVFLFLDI
jgi:hypothetical protein